MKIRGGTISDNKINILVKFYYYVGQIYIKKEAKYSAHAVFKAGFKICKKYMNPNNDEMYHKIE